MKNTSPDLDEMQAGSEHRAFMLTYNRALSRRRSISRIGIVVSCVLLVGSGFVMGSCAGLFMGMAICSLIAFLYGSPLQRICSFVLLAVAIGGFFTDYQHNLWLAERVQRVRDLRSRPNHQQRIKEQQISKNELRK